MIIGIVKEGVSERERERQATYVKIHPFSKEILNNWEYIITLIKVMSTHILDYNLFLTEEYIYIHIHTYIYIYTSIYKQITT